MKILAFSILYFIDKIIRIFYRQPRLAVLMYHSVSDTNWKFSLTEKELRSQLRQIASEGFKFIGPGNFQNYLDDINSLKTDSVLVTFDDGYKDFIDNALPVLKEFDIESLLFIHTSRKSNNLGNNFVLLNNDEISECIKQGVMIGNHTRTHPDLKTLARSELENEILGAQKDMMELFKERPMFFAYPGGKFNDEVVGTVKITDFAGAFTVNSGLIGRNFDRYRLKRIGMYKSMSKIEIKARLSVAGNIYEYIRRKLK